MQKSIAEFKKQPVHSINTNVGLNVTGANHSESEFSVNRFNERVINNINQLATNPTNYIDDYKENFLPNELRSSVCEYLDSCESYNDETTGKVLYFGRPHKYTRAHNQKTQSEIPAPFQKAQSLLVTSRLQQYKRDYATTESLYLSLLQQLQVSLNNTDHYEHILHLNSVKIDTTMQTFICKHSKKFQVLLDINNLHLVSPYNAFLQHHHKTQRTLKSTISGPLQITKPVPNKKTTIINLSDEKLTLDETSLLSLGLKFTPTPKNDPTTDIASHIQPAVKHLPDGIQSSIAHDVTHLLHSPLTVNPTFNLTFS